MTTPTPGQRLHAALLARDVVQDAWDSYHDNQRLDFEAAAREYNIQEGVARAERERQRTRDDLRDRIDALAAEVAALRRDRDADDAAWAEIGDRLSRAEADAAVLPDVVGRLARCEGRDGEVVERLGKLEKAVERNERHQGYWNKGADVRLSALEARAIDGGDPLRRNP